jgi:predicted DNA binding CopG/RHH family protein
MKQSKNTSEKKRKSRIPEFASLEEEAKWFESHSIADYQDEFKIVKATFAKNLSVGITIRFDQSTLNKIRELAHKKGIGPTTLARMWIMDHLNQQV